MEESRFTYVVNPRKPIKGIQDMPPIRSSKILKLTKEEALLAMKCGPVYRKFANEGIQKKVSTANIDRLHNEKYISELEYSGSNIPVIANKAIEQPKTTVEKESKNETPVKTDEVQVTEEKTNGVSQTDVESYTNEEVEVPESKSVDQVQSEPTQNVEEQSDEKVETEEVVDTIVEEKESPILYDNDNAEDSTSEKMTEAVSDSEVTNEDSDELLEANDNQPYIADYSGNPGRKKKKHRN